MAPATKTRQGRAEKCSKRASKSIRLLDDFFQFRTGQPQNNARGIAAANARSPEAAAVLKTFRVCRRPRAEALLPRKLTRAHAWNNTGDY